MPKKKHLHPFDLRTGKESTWISWDLSQQERAMVFYSLNHWLEYHCHSGNHLLIKEVLTPFAGRLQKNNRTRVNRTEAIALYLLLNDLNHLPEFDWLRRQLMDDIYKHILHFKKRSI